MFMIRARAEAIAEKYGMALGKHADKVIEGVNRRMGHCPCELITTADNLCPCDKFTKNKECRCQLFVKKEN